MDRRPHRARSAREPAPRRHDSVDRCAASRCWSVASSRAVLPTTGTVRSVAMATMRVPTGRAASSPPDSRPDDAIGARPRTAMAWCAGTRCVMSRSSAASVTPRRRAAARRAPYAPRCRRCATGSRTASRTTGAAPTETRTRATRRARRTHAATGTIVRRRRSAAARRRRTGAGAPRTAAEASECEPSSPSPVTGARLLA
jgi:hypothetical protein